MDYYSKPISIQSLIAFLLKEQKTGILSVKIPVARNAIYSLNNNRHYLKKIPIALNSKENAFLVKQLFFYSGKITHISENNRSYFTELKDYLTYYQLESQIDRYLTDFAINNNTSTEYYDCLIWLLQKKYLQSQQLREILSRLTKENIFEILISEQGQADFREHYRLDPFCYSNITVNTVNKLNHTAKRWQQFRPFITSPYQYLYVENKARLKESISTFSYNNILCWSNHKKTLIELSRQLNCSLIDIGRAFYPYVERKLISFKRSF